jgi:hypothetical protein
MYHVWPAEERMGRTSSLEELSQLVTKKTMPHHKPKRTTTYYQRYYALSALEVYTIGKIQHLWTLCALQLKLAEQLILPWED